ncbi:MAG: LysM peptidoglycan-binding domain-containing protein [Actinomycetota bacterium]
MSTSTLTAAYAPAEQLTFRPRTIDEAAPAAVQRPVLVAVPTEPVPARAEELATVHHLPVAHRDDVYRRRRLVALALLIGLVLGVASFVGSADATPTPEGQLAESVTVVVQPGDTLWAIATELDPDGDPRVLVDRLVGLAGSSSLQPGQELVVPSHWLG